MDDSTPGRGSRRSPRDPLSSLPPEEVLRLFHPTPRYDLFLHEARSPAHRIAMFFHAAYLEAFGHSPPLGPIPDYLVRHIAELVGVPDPEVPLPYPDHPRTFFAHADRIRRGLGWSKLDPKARQSFQRWLIEETHRTDDGRWLRERFLTRLREAKVTMPALYLIDRMVGHARTKATELIARSILSSLTDHQIHAADGLRRTRSGTGRSQLQWLKDPVGIPSPRSLEDVLDRILFIRGFLLPPESFERIHPDMRRRMTMTVEGYTVDSLWSDFPEHRRRALVASYLHERQRALVDLAVEIFDGIVLAMERRSEAELAGDLREHGPAINEKLHMFKTMAQIVVDAGIPDPSVRPAIYEKIPRDALLDALRDLENLLRPEDFNIFDYLESRYSFLRSFFPYFLRVIEFDGLPSAKALLAALGTLRYWNAEGIRKIKTLPPLDFVPDAWKPYVLPGDGAINRHYYELCVMSELHRALRATEVWAIGGRRYGNVEDLLIPPARWKEIRDECYHELGLPQDPKAWLAGILPTLEKQIQKTVDRLPENTYAIQDEDRVRLSPFDADLPSPGLTLVKDRIKAMWPQARIQDILVEVNTWVDLTSCFQTLRGYHKSGQDFERGLWAALIAKGCNIGTTRMASLTPEVAERSLRRIEETYLSEDTLESAYQRLLKAHRNLPIAKWLGEETVSMSDGMRVASRVGTVRAALLPHAFAPGVRAITYYWHVSHQGPGFAAQVIGHDRDAAYVLDQIFHIVHLAARLATNAG